MPVIVSVIIPLYNKAAYIRRSLDSVAAQTFPDFEVLVVNDGSTDGGERLAEEYPDPRFRLITQANAGPGAARNRGIAEAKGEWIAFLDADDEWTPGFLAGSLELAGRHREAVTVTSGYFEYPRVVSTEPMWRNRGIPEGLFRLSPETPPMRFVHILAFMCPWSTMVRAGTIRQWGGFYEHRCLYAEDAFLWLKILLNESVAFQLTPLVRFHREASDLSNNAVRRSPLEPFLSHPEEIQAVCPRELRPLLAELFAIRAFKRACVFGYWGQQRESNELRKRFSKPGSWRLPYYLPAIVAGWPLAAHSSALWQKIQQLRKSAQT